MPKDVSRLFPFARRANLVVVGRHNLSRLRKHLHFLLITEDLSPNSRQEILDDFPGMPMIERYRSADLETWFGLHNTKVIGFRKSSLATNLYRELKG